ncbi:MAG: hypothetical protein KAU29_00710 [Gammaproteobacteria bacterium]|nr:hypothetical protein [Gammaproteobacteria bacterium]
MKKIILAVFASMILASPVYAGEEIQLAAVMVDSNSSELTANKRIYALGDGRSSGGIGRRARDESFEYAIIAGIAVAVVLASTADGWDSTSNH